MEVEKRHGHAIIKIPTTNRRVQKTMAFTHFAIPSTGCCYTAGSLGAKQWIGRQLCHDWFTEHTGRGGIQGDNTELDGRNNIRGYRVIRWAALRNEGWLDSCDKSVVGSAVPPVGRNLHEAPPFMGGWPSPLDLNGEYKCGRRQLDNGRCTTTNPR
jgi:hypothetical protein